METLLFSSLRNCSKLWAGVKARLLTLTSSETDSSSAKSNDPILTRFEKVLKERDALREEVRLLELELNRHYDV